MHILISSRTLSAGPGRARASANATADWQICYTRGVCVSALSFSPNTVYCKAVIVQCVIYSFCAHCAVTNVYNTRRSGATVSLRAPLNCYSATILLTFIIHRTWFRAGGWLFMKGTWHSYGRISKGGIHYRVPVQPYYSSQFSTGPCSVPACCQMRCDRHTSTCGRNGQQTATVCVNYSTCLLSNAPWQAHIPTHWMHAQNAKLVFAFLISNMCLLIEAHASLQISNSAATLKKTHPVTPLSNDRN
jgi:hypothetical protein